MATLHELHTRIISEGIQTTLRFEDKKQAASLRSSLKQYDDRCRAQNLAVGLENAPAITVHMKWNAKEKTATFHISESLGKELKQYDIVE